MSDAVLAGIICAIASVLGVMLSTSKSTAMIHNEIKNLENELALYNNMVRRVPMIEEQIKDLSKRIQALESGKYSR